MTDYMKQGNDVDDPGPVEQSPFRRIYYLPPNRNGEIVEAALEGAQKIWRTTKNRGEIATDEAVEGACPLATTAMAKDWQYYRVAGPMASTADDLRWNTAYRLSHDAPEFKSDEWKAAAAELEIPDTHNYEMTPTLVASGYRYLEKKRDKDDRAVHPEELIGELNYVGYQFERAFEYMNELPGVKPPDDSGPAWEWIGNERADVEGESHA